MIAGYIAEQPKVIARCLAAARAFRLPWPADRFRAVVLVGSGSSFNALQTVRPCFVAARRGPVLVFEPQDFVAELPSGVLNGALVVVLSQSGASATSVAALVALAESLGAPVSPPITPQTVSAFIAPARDAAEALAAELGEVDSIVVAGRRAHHGIALEASLKIAEMAGIPTAAFPTEELLHGRLHGVTARSVVLMICRGSEEVAEAEGVRAVMARHGCRVITVSPSGRDWPRVPAGPEAPWDTLALAIPFQWLAGALAQAGGVGPG